MTLVALWDFKTVPKTVSRFTKKPDDKKTGFALIVLTIRNLLTMTSLAFFLWPAMIWWEVFENKDKS